MYVQLRSIQDVAIDGNVTRCHPGDWVDVGKQTAFRWIARGDAWAPDEKLAQALPGDAGIVIRGDVSARQQIGKLGAGLQITDGEPRLEYRYTLIWTPSLAMPKQLLGAGFHLLERWQLVVPLWDYDELAVGAGSQADREVAKGILHDLRVPLYDTRLIFVKRAPDTRRLLELWREWGEEIDDERLAFLVALYQARPLVCALPTLAPRDRGIR